MSSSGGKVFGLEATVLVGIVGNVLSTVGIVLANKYLWRVQDFKFMVFLSTCHFVFTAAAMRVLLWARMFTYKPVDTMKVLPLALGCVGSVGFMNLNLAHNSVGFYQISKLACIPVTLFLQYQWYGKAVSANVKGSLVIILAGVAIATVSDVTLNFTGMVFAGVAVFFTTFGQILTNANQKDLGLDALQLLYHTSPLMGAGMACLIPFFDNVSPTDPNSLINFKFTPPVVGGVLLTCLLAVGVNISNYLVIGKTSPVTYQVVGHLKTCLILILGFIVFEYPIIARNVFGITLAVFGMMVYSEIKRREQSNAPKDIELGDKSKVRKGIKQ
eukprot:TRINITY_DN9161_c0_g1_i1.p2 TRINITY_DN9161_c0_g1~~TRINITY_DN9161_c0_g1_i1.p2  ORF type:complete len:329 (+),score=190.78 TRINITY_DN9161_c0_g1_i1:98-1084(+)